MPTLRDKLERKNCMFNPIIRKKWEKYPERVKALNCKFLRLNEWGENIGNE